jgi:hypothetical protein
VRTSTLPIATPPDLEATVYYTQHNTGINPGGGQEDDWEMYAVVPPATTGSIDLTANQQSTTYVALGGGAYDSICRCDLRPGDHIQVWLVRGSMGYGTDAPPLGSLAFWTTQIVVTNRDPSFHATAADSVVPRKAFAGTWSDMTFHFPDGSTRHLTNVAIDSVPYAPTYAGPDSTFGAYFIMEETREFSGMTFVGIPWQWYYFFGTCPTNNSCSATFPGGSVTATR